MFKKLSQMAGMVGVDVTVDINREVPKDATVIDGKIRIEAKQDQTITKIKIEMFQHRTEGNIGADDREVDKDKIGELVIKEGFDIKAGEIKEVPFRLNFERKLSLKRKLTEKGGVIGMIGKAYTMSENERYNYWIDATVDVKGAANDPQGSQTLYFA